MYETRNYTIFSVTELDKIEIEQVLETSAETVRRSTDGTKTFVKWNGETPACISLLTTAEGPYSHAEMLEILSKPEWTADSGMT